MPVRLVSAGASLRPGLLTLLMILATALPAAAQKDQNIWHFGYGAALDFNRGRPEVVRPSRIRTQEGCASIADWQSGTLLFYTDGITVWNRNHEMMAGGSGLAGHFSSTQSALIVPASCKSRYYIVTSDAGIYIDPPNAGIHYSTVDMSANNGLGLLLQKNRPLMGPRAGEKLTAIPHANGQEFWVIAQAHPIEAYHAFRAGPDIIDPDPVISSFGRTMSTEVGYLKASPNGSSLLSINGADWITVAGFNRSSGYLNLSARLPLGFRQLYGASFAPGSRRFYVTGVSQENSRRRMVIDQYSFGGGLNLEDTRRRIFDGTSTFESGLAMQLAPDGKIYVSYAGSEGYLGVINYPDREGDDCDYDHKGLRVGDGLLANGLPNFIDARYDRLQFNTCLTARSAGVRIDCNSNCLDFSDRSDGNPSSWQWDFPGADPSSSTARNPRQICYAAPGRHKVRLIVRARNRADTTHFFVNIPAERIQVDAGRDTTICQGETAILEGRSKLALSARWSPAAAVKEPDSLRTRVTPLKTSTYYLRVRDARGCPAMDSVRVIVLPAPEIFTQPVRVCPDETVQLQAVINPPGDHYRIRWTPSTGLNDASVLRPILRTRHNGSYTLHVSDTNGCSASADLQVRVFDPREVQVWGDSLICAGGVARLFASGAESYQWSPAASLDDPFSASPRARPESSSTYTVVFRSGDCVDSAQIQVNVHPSFRIEMEEEIDVCAGDTIELRPWIVAESAGGDYDFRWEPASMVSDPAAARPELVVRRTGWLYLEVTDRRSFCRRRDSILLNAVKSLESKIDAESTEICAGDSVRLRARGGSEFRWFPATELDDPASASPLAWPKRSTTFTLIATSGTCRYTAEIYIRVVEQPSISLFTPPVLCSNDPAGVQLRVNGSDEYDYRWSPAVGLDDPRRKEPIARPAGSTHYTLWAVNAAGCATQASVVVTVRPAPVIKAAPVTAICRGDVVELRVTGPPGRYRWSPAVGLSDPERPQTLAAPRESAWYFVDFHDGFCAARDSVFVSVLDPAVIDAGRDTTICAGDQVRLGGSGNAGAFVWSPADGLDDPRVLNPVAAPTRSTVYRLRGESESGCPTEDSVLVKVEARSRLSLQAATLQGSYMPGERLRLPITAALEGAWASEQSEIRAFSLALRFDSRNLDLYQESPLAGPAIDGWTLKSSLSADKSMLLVQAHAPDSAASLRSGEVLALDFEVLLSTAESLFAAVLPELRSLDGRIDCAEIREIDGGLTLDRTCLHNARGIVSSSTGYALRILSAPLSKVLEIEYSVALPAHTKVAVFDVTGRRIALVWDAHRPPGSYRSRIRMTDSGAGLYFLRFSSGPFHATEKVLTGR